jgi:phosphotriesterase-related protein
MIFCHLDRSASDIGVHKELCSRGIYLEYDTIDRPKYHDNNKEMEIILGLLEAGYGERLLLGLDTTRPRLRSYGGSPGLCYMIEDFIPFMLKNGIGQTDTVNFFVKNPARIFDKQILP